ncbi:hypothetical protein [Nostoc sp. PCC 7107]|uniref:hypothetical protein n=1 Tax=Nostoc sp. PCC 7107 TaxID=317936 RepID=UPI00029ED8E4|nr:hypothetical protein [Nostoc sp. PCC 7107]AFY43430.1 hypothetical protein Nos7107_2833 [Nostoc sp. PCC 7107]
MSFVGYKQASSPAELRKLLQDYYQQPSYYFLRWSHQVSGIKADLPANFPSPEGQMFNTELELRWKQNNEGYQVLFLGRNQPKLESKFNPIGKDWITSDRKAHFYDKDETKFPKGFTYPEKLALALGQRYFQDAQTSTIHFVALTVCKNIKL